MNTKKKLITLVVANPVRSSFSFACGDTYQKAAEEAGATVHRFNTVDMEFDPVLHDGYNTIQALEPDLVKFQNAIKASSHLVFIYPNWWTTMPAKMKGLFDRSFLPGFAFKFEKEKFTPLLKGKTARVINISGSIHPMLLWCAIGPYTNELEKGILKSCGVAPVKTTSFGPTRNAKQAVLERWLAKVAVMAKRDST